MTSVPLGAGFPKGLFALHDTQNAGASASNVKYVPWESIARALGLGLDASYDPRVVGR